MGLQYFKRGVYAGGAGNRDLSSDLVMSSGGLAFDAAITASTAAKVFLTTGTTDAHYQSSASATTTERSLHFPHSASYARLLATSSHVWLVTAKSTGVLQESTG